MVFNYLRGVAQVYPEITKKIFKILSAAFIRAVCKEYQFIPKVRTRIQLLHLTSWFDGRVYSRVYFAKFDNERILSSEKTIKSLAL